MKDIENKRGYHFINGDITNKKLVNESLRNGIDVIVNFAAESHVDRSILDASPFIETNIKGTHVLLEGARQHRVERFIQISTDEVYGSIDSSSFTELSSLRPSNPYASSKAAADLLCCAYFQTYHLPVIITRCTNNFGPYQFPEKLVALAITNALEDKSIPIYGKGLNIRDWIYIDDHCKALELLIQKGRLGETYNIAADQKRTNLELIYSILDIMNKPRDLITFVADRPGHDQRYALDTTKITREINWQPDYSLEKALIATVDWYTNNESWWQQAKSGKFAQYYKRMYLDRLKF